MVDHLMKAFIKESHGQSAQMRVRKGIYRIWDLIKIWCRNRENHNIFVGSGILLLFGKRDSPKFGYGVRDFFHLSVRNLGNCHGPNWYDKASNKPRRNY